MTALVEGDDRMADLVINNDYKVNAMEVALDEECSRVLARRQPTAGDLRLVVAVIKTITDWSALAMRPSVSPAWASTPRQSG